MIWPEWSVVAFKELLRGVHEIPGPDHHEARILMYQRACSGPFPMDDETPWCAAFVNWCLEVAGFEGTRLRAARSFQGWGVQAPAMLGAIAVLWRGQRDGWQGHVGFLVGEGPGTIRLLAGNQHDSVSIEDFPAGRLLGYRCPGPSDSALRPA